MKCKALVIFVSLTLFMTGTLFAADTGAIEDLQNDVSATRNKANGNNSRIQALEAEVYELWQAMGGSSDTTPPVLTPGVPAELFGSPLKELSVTAQDGNELSYVAIQNNTTSQTHQYFVAPGGTSYTLTRPFELENGVNEILFTAADIYGNTGKELFYLNFVELTSGFEETFDSYGYTKNLNTIELWPDTLNNIRVSNRISAYGYLLLKVHLYNDDMSYSKCYEQVYYEVNFPVDTAITGTSLNLEVIGNQASYWQGGYEVNAVFSDTLEPSLVGHELIIDNGYVYPDEMSCP